MGELVLTARINNPSPALADAIDLLSSSSHSLSTTTQNVEREMIGGLICHMLFRYIVALSAAIFFAGVAREANVFVLFVLVSSTLALGVMLTNMSRTGDPFTMD